MTKTRYLLKCIQSKKDKVLGNSLLNRKYLSLKLASSTESSA